MIKKVKKIDGTKEIYIFGIKCFSYKKNEIKIIDKGINNHINIKDNDILCHICGDNNMVSIEKQCRIEDIVISIYGNNNKIFIEQGSSTASLKISIGNHYPINNAIIRIGKGCWFGGVRIVMESDNSELNIGNDCILSTGILIRLGEYPHLIFNKDSGEYLDKSVQLNIGNHVWLGENCTLLKNAQIPNNSIVGTNAVVTKKFDEKNVIIAGNPATIKKRNIFWERDVSKLDKNSSYYISLKDYKENVIGSNIWEKRKV